MIEVLSTNITSPLGLTTDRNYEAVKSGISALKVSDGWRGVPGRICAGAFSPEQRKELSVEGLTWFESLAVRSAAQALEGTEVDIASARTGFILSTTKADVENLRAEEKDDDSYRTPGEAAEKIASRLGITTTPLTVCNACISGVTAQILADRLISSGKYDTVVVCGADTLSPFCLAGFTSFKALSSEPCRPFDIERLGLNLGEGAATMVFTKAGCGSGWRLISSALTNDAYHVSAPSPAGEGLARAAKAAMGVTPASELAVVSVHGTATMFNDQSESVAVAAAGLGEVPVCAWKPHYGHTLGAAGVIEAILTMEAVDDGTVPPVKGFEEIGVSGSINVSGSMRTTGKSSFLKIISGFGGCNGAVLYSRDLPDYAAEERGRKLSCRGKVRITPDGAFLDGKQLGSGKTGGELLTEIYRTYLPDNPRFYKMDLFSRLAYVAGGLLLKDRTHKPEKTSMVLFNRSSSIIADRQHLGTFLGRDEFYPSPSVFLNTLPNVVMGELSAKFGVKGETTFIILPGKDRKLIDEIIGHSLCSPDTELLVTGWVNADSETEFEAEIEIYE